MKVLYFAWIRERIGVGQENIDLPDNINNLEQFLSWMKTRGENYEYALESPDVLRIALDQNHCNDLTTPINNNSEIALFPPMTGG